MAVQQYELLIMFKAELLMAEFGYPVTSPAVNTTSTQPQPPIILQGNECLYEEKKIVF